MISTISRKVLDFVLGDLPNDTELFPKLYYDREKEIHTLSGYLQTCYPTGNNILIVGRRGVGKTTIIEKLKKENSIKRFGYSIKTLDMRRIPIFPNINDTILNVLRELNKILRDFLRGMNIVLEAFSEEMSEYSVLCEHMGNINFSKIKKKQKLLLIIDDIDYTPNEFQANFLLLLRPLFCSEMVVILYSARPEAERTARGHYDTTLNTVFRHVSWLYIHSLPSSGLINSRMKYLIERPLYIDLVNHLKTTDGHSEEEDNITSDLISAYPFTTNQETFFDSISNGNAKYILDMAKHLYQYFEKNENNLKNEGNGYVVGMDKILEIFDIRNVKESPHAIVDVATKRSRRRYSLTYSSLEYVFADGRIPGSYYDFMKKRGFMEKRLVDDALNRCHIEYDFIEQEILGISTDILKYQLTPKGRYYLLYLSRKREYLAKYGSIKRSLSLFEINDKLYDYLFEFIRNLYNSMPSEQSSVTLDKGKVFNFFLKMFPEVHSKADVVTPETPSLILMLDILGFDELLTTLGEAIDMGREGVAPLFSKKKVNKKNYYIFYRTRMEKLLLKKYGSAFIAKDMFPSERYLKFLNEVLQEENQ
ncbi:MAG: hypothetical protein EPO24_06800 [Bacteroidetes bacterium]|nr:MAG: hypothetical protein EPO24_06800 [Bacteroidota bacterium]